jgi:FHA domain-containing protein
MIKISVVSYNNETPTAPLSALFGPDGASIGRSNDNFLVLQDPKRYVSRVQASVKSDGTNHAIVNLSQANPILVNGEEIAMGQDVALKFGDEIQIGLYLLKAESPVAQAQNTAPLASAASMETFAAPAPAVVPVIPKAQSTVHADPLPLDLNNLGGANDDPFADLLGGAVNVPANPPVVAPVVAPPPPTAKHVDIAPTSASDPLGIDALLGTPAPAPAAMPTANNAHADSFSFDDLLGTPPSPAATPAVPHQAQHAGAADPFNFDDLLGNSAQPMSHTAPAQLPGVHDNPFGFDDLLGNSGHNVLPTQHEPRAQLIPDDFDPFALPSAAPRNSIDPLSGLSSNDVSLEDLAGKNISIDGLMSSSGNAGPSILDPVALGPTASSETDPLALFASESLLPTQKEAPIFGDVASNHTSELNAHFTLPQARQEVLPENVHDGLLNHIDTPPAPLGVEIAPIHASADPLMHFETPLEAAPVQPLIEEPLVVAPVSPVAPVVAQAPAAVPPKQPMSLVEEALKAKPLAPPVMPHSADLPKPMSQTQPQTQAATAPVNKPAPPAKPQTAAATPVAEQAAAGSQLLDSRALAEAFLRGANLPLDTMPAGITLEWMETLGRMMAAATDGTVELIASRALVKREVKADLTMIVVRNNNPLKFLPDGQSALIQMMGRKIPGFMEPIEAMQDAYIDLRAHQIGVVAGMRAALDEVLRRFDPEILEKKLKTRTLLDSLVAANRKAKMWDLYGELFKDIYIEAQDDFQTLFGKAFLTAYEGEIARFRQESPT